MNETFTLIMIEDYRYQCNKNNIDKADIISFVEKESIDEKSAINLTQKIEEGISSNDGEIEDLVLITKNENATLFFLKYSNIRMKTNLVEYKNIKEKIYKIDKIIELKKQLKIIQNSWNAMFIAADFIASGLNDQFGEDNYFGPSDKFDNNYVDWFSEIESKIVDKVKLVIL